MNPLVQFFTDGEGEHSVVFSPDDHRRVRDATQPWGEIGFPWWERVSHGHEGFDDAWALTILVRPFRDRPESGAGGRE